MTRPKLLDQLRGELRARHYSRRTEKAYCLWVRRFVLFNGLRHPADLGESEVNEFLTHLAVVSGVSASTQNQALAALLFLYRHVLHRELGQLGAVVRARKPQRLPVVLTPDEVRDVLAEMDGEWRLMASLMYGAGLRLTEACGCGCRTSTSAATS
jgi:site-specific recombinase XerD